MGSEGQQVPAVVGAKNNASWLADVDAYVASHTTSVLINTAIRTDLISSVKANPQSAEAWIAWLAHEESEAAAGVSSNGQPGADASKVCLYHMYYWATQLVPRSKNQQKEAYLQLWVGYARHQWARSPDDARDTFKTLKNQHIGDGSAHLYHQWAVLEHSTGNISKALGILSKGLRSEAQPAVLLEQLRAEMQSGTFDPKYTGSYTETLTIDSGSAAARQLQMLGATPRPTSTSAAEKAANVPECSCGASCLKGSKAAPYQATRAVKFALDVQAPSGQVEAGSQIAGQGIGGCPSASSSRPSSSRAAEGHTGCMSVSSSSSRSTGSVHDGTVNFSSGVASYKSSTTETSGLEGMEEDTISCTAAAGTTHPGSRGTEKTKPSTAALDSQSAVANAGPGGSNTATLGLKRFGFKSRALRVGGASDGAATAATESVLPDRAKGRAAAGTMPPLPPVVPTTAASHVAICTAAVAALAGAQKTAAAAAAIRSVHTVEDDSGSRKRRACAGTASDAESAPQVVTSHKLPQGELETHALVQSCNSYKVAGMQADVGSVSRGRAAAASDNDLGSGPDMQLGIHISSTAAGGCPDDKAFGADDSVPLVSSKLAARIAPDKGTPLPAAKDSSNKHPAGWRSEAQTPPVDGQLPSSLDSTPEAGVSTAGCSATLSLADMQASRHAVADISHSASSHAAAAETELYSSSSRARAQAAEQAEMPAAANLQAQSDGDHPVLPTVVLLTAAPTVAPEHPQLPHIGRPSGTGRADAPHLGASLEQQQRQTPASNIHAAGGKVREPLRPLQAVPQPSTSKPAPAKMYNPGSSSTNEQSLAAAPGMPRHVQVQQLVDPPRASAQHQLQHQHSIQHQQQQQQQQQQRPQLQQQLQVVQHVPQQQQQEIQHVHAQQHQQQQQQQQTQVAIRQSHPREDAQTVYVQGVRYTKLECVGRGGSSKVFKVMAPNCKIYALKRIRLAGRDAEAASGFIDEINLLLCLRNKPNIIQLIDSQVFQAEGLIYMVQEYGEIDLARLLAKHDASRRVAAGMDVLKSALLQDNLDENFIRLYWQQMLQAVAGVHEQRIVHSDLKPANFLLVEGQLKLIDFGIAKAINGDTTSIARESQVGTLNYMSPEAILGGSNNILGGPAMKVGRPSDVWSLGCILYQMVYGRTPFAELPFLPKMHAICNPQHQVVYPVLVNTDLVDVMRRCLDRDPKTRISLQDLLDHCFLHPNRRKPPAAAPSVGLSEEQMKLLVAQVAAAGAAGVTDIDKLTRELMRKLGNATGEGSAKLIQAGSSRHTSSRHAETGYGAQQIHQAPPALHQRPQQQMSAGSMPHAGHAGANAYARNQFRNPSIPPATSSVAGHMGRQQLEYRHSASSKQ